MSSSAVCTPGDRQRSRATPTIPSPIIESLERLTSVNTKERTFLILKNVNKTPSLASCSICQRKFFTPNSYYNDRVGAEMYLQEKFDHHECHPESTVQSIRRW
jgi:hypothetical protein